MERGLKGGNVPAVRDRFFNLFVTSSEGMVIQSVDKPSL